jgi:hypothetical protein
MKYPAKLTTTIADMEVAITDADGRIMFRFSGATIFEGSHRTPAYKVMWKRVRWPQAPVFHFTDLSGKTLYSTKRDSFSSFVESQYQMMEGNQSKLEIREGKALGKIFGGLFDGTLFEEVSTRVWSPAYVVARPDGTRILTLDKRRTFIGKQFTIRKQVEVTDEEERLAMLGLLIIFIERRF